MKKYSPIGTIIHGIAVFMGVAGISLFVYGLVASCPWYRSHACIFHGIVLFILSFFAYGFGYVVEAAYRYLDNEYRKEEICNPEGKDNNT